MPLVDVGVGTGELEALVDQRLETHEVGQEQAGAGQSLLAFVEHRAHCGRGGKENETLVSLPGEASADQFLNDGGIGWDTVQPYTVKVCISRFMRDTNFLE
ncbi:hypothetical protein [Trueperella pyogenes]|uniref:hypothetical protein n=1 Tax=Trueperella pyogenes TaxID=1661 RepID=UPI003DA7AC0D